jgi:hypothetical protein
VSDPRDLEGLAKKYARALDFGRHRDSQHASVSNLRFAQRKGKVARHETRSGHGRRARVRVVERLDDTAPPSCAFVFCIFRVVHVVRVRRARGGGVNVNTVVALNTNGHV